MVSGTSSGASTRAAWGAPPPGSASSGRWPCASWGSPTTVSSPAAYFNRSPPALSADGPASSCPPSSSLRSPAICPASERIARLAAGSLVSLSRAVAAGKLEFLAPRRARTDENRVEAAIVEQRFHALDAMPQLQLDPHVEYVADLLVEHVGRQAKRRDVGAHEAAGGFQRFENRHVVAERP